MKEKKYSEWMSKQGFDVLRHANCCKIAFNGGWESRQTEVDELQKRVDAATAKWISIISILTTTESNVPDVIYQQLDELHDALCGYELEQALKGGGV